MRTLQASGLLPRPPRAHGPADSVEAVEGPLSSPGNAADASPLSRASQPHLDNEACCIHTTGDIPCERRGKGHRRARLSDVLAYKETRSARVTELARMREAAADGSLYDLDLSDQKFAQFVNAP